MHPTKMRLLWTVWAVVGLGGVAGCGPDEARHQRARGGAGRARGASGCARQGRARRRPGALQENLDLARRSARAQPRPAETAPASDPVAEAPPPPIPVVASPGEQVSRPSEAVKQLQKTIAALEAIEAAGIECNNIAANLRAAGQAADRPMPEIHGSHGTGLRVDPHRRDVERSGEERSSSPATTTRPSSKRRRLTETVQHYNDFAWSRMRTITGQAKP